MNRITVTHNYHFLLFPRMKRVDWGMRRFLTIRWLGLLIQVTL